MTKTILHKEGVTQLVTADKRPLVAIGVPATDRVHTDFAQCLWGIARGVRGAREGIVFGRSSMIVNARNQIVDGARAIKADYLLFIDSDITFPYTAIDRLLAHGKDIVGATYPRRAPPFDLLGHSVDPKIEVKTGLVEMTHMPTGMLFIKMSVFDRFKAPIFRFRVDEANGMTHGEDFEFCRMAREDFGFKVWCDMDLTYELRHLMEYGLGPNDAKSLQAQVQSQAHG